MPDSFPQPRLTNATALLLRDPDAFATPLVALVADRFGLEVLDPDSGWDGTTLKLELETMAGGEIPPGNIDQVRAGGMILFTDLFQQSLPHFIQICNILAGNDFSPQIFDPADVREMAWGVTEALILYPPEEAKFSPDIQAYIKSQMKAEGFDSAPSALQLVMGNQAPDVSSEFTDDPEMFEAFFQKQQTETALIDQIVKENVLKLADQLAMLQLENGDAQPLVDRIRKRFGATLPANS